MNLNITQALKGALAGWAGMTGMVYTARKAGMTRMDVMQMEGALFARPKSTVAEVTGFFIHLGMSLWIGLVYALGFKLTGLPATWRSGALGGLIHWAIASAVVGVMSRKHPKRKQLPMPGFGGTALGAITAVGFFVGHLLYGMLFGWQYERGKER